MRSFDPIQPDPDTARQWIEDELAKDNYRPASAGSNSNWFDDLFGGIGDALGRNPVVASVLIGLLVALVLVAIIRSGPVRRARAARKSSRPVFGDDRRTSAGLRQAADDAAAAGDWSLAAVERFRAVVRGLDERGDLVEMPGATAFEAAAAIARMFAPVAVDAFAAGDTFDLARYGHRPVEESQYRRVVTLDDAVSRRHATVAAS